MNVHDFMQECLTNELASYSLSEGRLNPHFGYLAEVPGTQETYEQVGFDELKKFTTKHIHELSLNGRYIHYYRDLFGCYLRVCIRMSKFSAREYAELNGDMHLFDLEKKTFVPILFTPELN